MKRSVDIRERIAVRAYYAWLAGSIAGAAADWLAAEAIETALTERRVAAAAKAAATGRTKTKAPAEMLVATAKRRLPTRPSAH